MGPGVSWVFEMGIIPDRLHNPTVGFMPTMPLKEDGETMEPSVSVPIDTAHKLAATATAEPELDPDGLLSSMQAFLVCPPLLLHPLDDLPDLKFDHSLQLVLPNITAPASLSFEMIKASFAA